ncbi:MAG TPA: hypothetical protein IAB49_03860 [Candidatus Caccenecus avistercoris]|nr:hypothetical protein [Candidatus Caccenecus avistercoris]
MEIEKLKVSHTKRNILIGGIIIILLIGITLTFTRAKYRTTQSIPLLNGTINYELSDLNLIGAYIQEGEEYVKTNTIPTSGYEFNAEESYCTINNERDDNITLSFDMTTQNLTVTPLTTKGTKCYLYFDEKLSAGDTILAASKPQGQTTDWTGQTTYYYTGKPNNWVQFAGFWWRIIRINGDGSIRMIYQGTSANEKGTRTQIRTSDFNNSANNNMYVGYMYQSGVLHGLQQSSTIKNVLDSWYQSNLETNYGQYIDGNAGFCGDRRVSSGTGGGTSSTDYQPYTRIRNSSPSLSCNKNDIYTTDEFELGNGALTYPIGLISADEAMFAGIPWSGSNQNNYLYTGQYYWTMSPYGYYSSSNANVFRVWSNGSLYNGSVNNASGVRPVINLKSAIAITGSGSKTDPFKVG